ncbi:conserved hypothetical protein [Candidatus Magnetomoraceae bacterium gMMP-15]
MNTAFLISKNELKKKLDQAFKISERAVSFYPKEYSEIKKLLKDILYKQVDIDEYLDLATQLADLLKTMNQVGTGTIFHVPYKWIDPRQCGKAQSLRFECQFLFDGITDLYEWRTGRYKLRLIKS